MCNLSMLTHTMLALTMPSQLLLTRLVFLVKDEQTGHDLILTVGDLYFSMSL